MPHSPFLASPVDESLAAPDEGEILAWHLIRLATTIRRATSQRFRRMFDMSMIEWLVLTHLAAEAAVSLTGLARNAGLDTQRTSRAVAHLATRDLVSRKRNPSNRREALVALTPRGRAVFNAMIENWLNKELAHGFTAAELGAATEVVRRLAAQADLILARETKGAT